MSMDREKVFWRVYRETIPVAGHFVATLVAAHMAATVRKDNLRALEREQLELLMRRGPSSASLNRACHWRALEGE